MKKTFDLDTDKNSEIITLDDYGTYTKQTSVNIYWTGASGSMNGQFQILVFFDKDNPEAFDVVGSIPVNTPSGRETRFTNFPIAGLQIRYQANGNTNGVAMTTILRVG